MKLRTKYILFVLIVHLIALVLSYFVFDKDKIFFIVSEVFVLISILIAWSLYYQLIQPLKSLMTGVDAIKDQDFNVKFLPTGSLEVDQLIGVYNQMMDTLREERTLQEQQHFFLEKLIRTSPTGIVILDYDDQVQQINPKALEILDISEKEILNQPVSGLAHPFFKHISDLKTGETRTVKLKGAETYKIQKSHFVDRGFPRHFIMLEELTAEILAAEKNVYGKVIRMMAHEVNNTIGPVNSIIESTLNAKQIWQHSDENMLREALEVAVDRNQNLNLFMRNFADLVKLPMPSKKQIDLHQVIRSVTRLMEIRAGERKVKLITEAGDQPFYIFGDEQQLEQALINIVKNAIEAIETEGIVRLATDAAKRKLTIADNGKGISLEESEQLFTPFFSTKKDGQGIGLTLVREILLNHGFEFSLKTVAERQTEFIIQFG